MRLPIFLTKAAVTASLFLSGFAIAQSITGKSVKITVNGTSPMHDWAMKSTSGSFSGTAVGTAINNVKFVAGAKTLKSEKGKMMDNKAYDALKADKNPNITFVASSLPVGKSTLTGKLTVAGVTKTVSFPVTVVKNGASYNISGSESLKMSEFGMETPGFLGVHTGDTVTVTVNIVAK